MSRLAWGLVVATGLWASVVRANVFEMPPGLANLETVTVGDPGNEGELSGSGVGGHGPDRVCGSVAYTYSIGKYEVTAGQYTEFLNAVAKTDTYGLYNTAMWSDTYGCKIQRTGTSGSCVYSVAQDYANRPVTGVSWGDAARFANWLHNGQPTGQQNTSTTENGAYALNGATTNAELLGLSRQADWKWAIASEDEWYKAAYYRGGSTSAGYWGYPTCSDTISPNMANYDGSAGGATDVGFYACASPYGTFDQGGNVLEWNDAVIGSCYGLRGGSFDEFFFFPSYPLLASYRVTFCSEPEDEGYLVGFRLVEVPEPGSLLLLAIASMILAPRLSRRNRTWRTR